MSSKLLSELTREEWDEYYDYCWLMIEKSDNPFHWYFWAFIETYNMKFKQDKTIKN